MKTNFLKTLTGIIFLWCCFSILESFAQTRIEWDVSTRKFVTNGVYARAKKLKSGELALVYSEGPDVWIRKSGNNGTTWGAPVNVAHTNGYNNTNSELIQLQNGWLLYAWNGRPLVDGSVPFTIKTKISRDNGTTWGDERQLYTADSYFTNGCWEPAMLQIPSGEIQLFFANENPYRNNADQEITLMRSFDNGLTWGAPKATSYRAGARDGMPVPVYLNNNKGIAYAIEDNGFNGNFKPVIIWTSSSENWNQSFAAGNSPRRWGALRSDVALPSGVYAGAPYLAQLPSGETILSCQSSEGRVNGDAAIMRVYIGDDNARNFANPTTPFTNVPGNGNALWNGLTVIDDNTIMAVSSINGAGQNGIWTIIGKVIRPINGNGDGLSVQYFNGMNFESHKVTTKVDNLDIDWGTGSPNSLINVDGFSAKYAGQIQPRYSENYTFTLRSDNGRRLWINNQLIIDKWIDDWDIDYSGTIALQAGVKYDIRIEYFENWGGANARLEWSSPSQARQVVPKSQLYSVPMSDPPIIPGSCIVQATDPGAWILRNDWSDQTNGSSVTTEAGSLKINHRQWGRNYLWFIESGKQVSLVAGKEYTISFDYRDGSYPTNSIEVGFASSYAWNGPTLIQPTVITNGFSNVGFAGKSMKIKSNVTQNAFLVFKLNFPSQPSQPVSYLIKNIKVCEPGATAKMGMQEESEFFQSFGMIELSPNPFTEETFVSIPDGIQGPITVTITSQTGEPIHTFSANASESTIPLGKELKSGFYFVNLSGSFGNKAFKLVKF